MPVHVRDETLGRYIMSYASVKDNLGNTMKGIVEDERRCEDGLNSDLDRLRIDDDGLAGSLSSASDGTAIYSEQGCVGLPRLHGLSECGARWGCLHPRHTACFRRKKTV
jgi:hypothetical protein